MKELEDKKHIIIPIIALLIGTIIGSILTIFLFPDQCPVCNCDTKVEETEQEEVKGSTVEVITEEQPIVSESTVSLPIPSCSINVDISGAVKDPGVYCFKEGSKLVDAVKRASGFAKGVAYRYVAMKINLSSPISNHQKIYIPFEEDVYCEVKSLQYVEEPQSSTQQEEIDNNTSDSTQSCININTATKDQLITLDGIGESTAQKIIDARPFEKVEDILEVSGIGDATYEKFKDDICV